MPKIHPSELLKRASEKHANKFTYGPFVKDPKRKGQMFTVICPEHGQFFQPVSAHLGGKGCKQCAMDTLREKQRHTIESVKAKVAKYNWDYEYTGLEFFGSGELQPNIKYICKSHGPVTQNLYNHLAGKGCWGCRNVKLRDTLGEFSAKASEIHAGKYTYLEMVHGVERGGVSRALVSVVCPEHGEFTQEANAHMSGHGCPKCAKSLISETHKLSKEEVLADWPADGYSFVRLIAFQGQGQGQRVVSSCSRHGEFEQGLYGRLRLGQGCPSCSGTVSSLSRSFALALQSSGLVEGQDFVLEYRPEGQRKIWDFFFPGKGIAVELHGVFWHSSKYCEPSEIQDKHEAGLALGFRTLHFYEDELLGNLNLCVRHTLNAVGLSADRSVYARKLKAVSVDYQSAKSFLQQHHIQGAVPAKYFGLVDDSGNLLAVAGFAERDSGSGRTSSTACELVRFATACRVTGGLGKLLKLAQQVLKFNKVISFSDVRLHQGSVYAKLGFTVEHKVSRDYMYVVRNQRKHKSGFQKSALAKRYPNLDLSKSEKVLTEELKLYRIYDCGKLKWVKTW
jgi:hypothetical protein